MNLQSIARSYISLMDEEDKVQTLLSLDANGITAKESDMGRRYLDLWIGERMLVTVNKWALSSDEVAPDADLGYHFDRGYLKRVEAHEG